MAEQLQEALKRTVLHQTHQTLGAKLVPFGGYDMPVWYTGVQQEHKAVRQACGLFDVTHMGVWDVRGENAGLFLDALASNDVQALAVGESQYAYLLDDQAHVIDDIMIYHLEKQRFLVVVNASNNDQDWAWVTQPTYNLHGRSKLVQLPNCQVRDLRAVSSGTDQLVDLAIQGPSSLQALLSLANTATGKTNLQQLERTQIVQVQLAGLEVFVSRTGYTGESVGYEIFVHPDACVQLWNALLEAGTPFGLLPCGLAARDALRTEAGLPLYGHELAGELDLGPLEIGFGGYVKSYKPFFIGRQAYVEKARNNNRKLVRFGFEKKGVRPPKQGTPIYDNQRHLIGTVTSCAQDAEGFLIGLAVLTLPYPTKEGTSIYFSGRADSAPLDEAKVYRRFPAKKK